MFLVPTGQGKFTYYEKQLRTREIRGLKISNTVLVPKTIDLIDYYKKERDLTIIEVKNINDILKIVF